MIDRFYMNGFEWMVVTVPCFSEKLRDRTGTLTVATTDPVTKCIYLSESLHGSFLKKVLIHEMTHVTMWSYGLIERIHQYCKPEYYIDMEEFICNVLADYGEQIFRHTYKILGDKAMYIVPVELERLVA